MTRLSAKEARELLGLAPKRSKYGNKRVTVNGRTYASEAEARHCEALILLEQAGKIGGLELQKRFQVLGPKGELVCTYVADAAYWDHEHDRFRVIDVKGVETKEFRLKRKLVKAFLGIEIEVVAA